MRFRTMVCQAIVSQNSIELPTLAYTIVAAGVKTFGSLFRCERRMEAWAGIEPAIELLQSSALPLGYHAALQSNATHFRRERTGLPKQFEFQADSPLF